MDRMPKELRWVFVAAALIVAAVAVFVLYAFNPATTGVYPQCPFHWLTGWHCPGCGSLRAVHCMLHGDFGRALALNPLMLLAMPFACWMLFNPSWVYRTWVPWAAFSVLVAYGVARNIPFMPFQLLSPLGSCMLTR